MTTPPSPATEHWDKAVLAVLDRIDRLTEAEAIALDATMRERPEVMALAWKILRGIENEGWFWGTYPDWQTPFDQCDEAARRVGIALGVEVPRPYDDSVVCGAARAAECAVLGSWASHAPSLREPWDLVIVP